MQGRAGGCVPSSAGRIFWTRSGWNLPAREADCAQRLHDAALQADLIIIEGAMGLFDGDFSAADLALRFGLPVLAVIDAYAMAGTFGALAYGLQRYRRDLRFVGVLANRVASPGHAGMLKAGLRDPAQWLGAVLHGDAMILPERHLGLVPAGELADAQQRLDAAADALAATPLGQMNADGLQDWTVNFPAPRALSAVAGTSGRALHGVRIAVARDAAFCFIYAANIGCLEAMGAHVTYFSPLADPELPPCDAVWLPGGYPELHAQALAANAAMKSAILAHVENGKPVWAECGGMMALFESLILPDGSSHPMWGVLPGSAALHRSLAAIGAQQMAFAGGVLRGHAFHYSTCSTPLAPAAYAQPAHRRVADSKGEALYVSGPSNSVRASYFHAWFASNPQAAASLFQRPRHD
jgi:cobyrinic acid a,c-diamide synthase